MQEIWKNVIGYEDYQVSNYGRIKSIRSNKILKVKNNGYGYYQCTLHKEGKQHLHYIHKLVAQSFLKKENFKSCNNEEKMSINLDCLEINHKDEDKTNNCVDNLEWCTHSYNMNYGNRTKKSIEKIINNKKTSKQIIQYDLNGNFIKKWVSMGEIQRQLGIFKQAIYQCCRRKKKTAGGYIWRYADEL